MIRSSKSVLSLALVLHSLEGCSGDATSPTDSSIGGNVDTSAPGGGASTGSGGGTVVASSVPGGAPAVGGVSGLGGVSGPGGATATGGALVAGGTTSKGGSTLSGGATATGGTTAKGGATSSGGASSSGGAPVVGGTTSKGGASTVGGATSSGGSAAKGGTTSAGGTTAKGGTTSTGGTTAKGGTTSAGGASSSCGAVPVSPNPTQQAKNLLCYLYSVYGKGVLSGQQETSWSNPAGDISWYTSNGMDAPAILGGDYLYDTSTTTRAIAYWNAGGISMIRYHMGMPPNSDTYENSQLAPGSGLLDQVITPGNSNYNSFVGKLDYVATQVQRMKDANAPVILALFHEYQQGGWFWWSKGSADQFKKIWIFTFNYLTATKGLNNIIWLAPSSGSPNASWYPGKQYIDIAGPDTYATDQPFTSLFSSAKGVIGSTVPIPLHETGLIPNPTNMFPSAAPWVLFNIWAGYQKDGSHNSTSNIQSVYANAYTITRSEVPNLK